MSGLRARTNPDALVTWPSVDAAVERLSGTRFRLNWTISAEPVQIFLGNEKVGEGVNSAEVALSPPVAVQPQFTLHTRDGQRLTVAERMIALESGVNFRDVGGYRTQDGRHVRWGQVYRSGMLSRLTDADVEMVDELGVRLVCDYRSHSESVSNPNRLPSGKNLYRSLAMETRANRYWQVARIFWHRNRLRELLLEGYTRVVLGENAAIIGESLRLMADAESRPLVIHCTAGKDRTGLVAGLLLTLLGVDEATVLADYSLSNLAFDGYAATLERDIARLGRLGFSAEQVRPLLVADPVVLAAALAYVRDTFGSVANYLTTEAGLTSAEIQQLVAQMVE